MGEDDMSSSAERRDRVPAGGDRRLGLGPGWGSDGLWEARWPTWQPENKAGRWARVPMILESDG